MGMDEEVGVVIIKVVNLDMVLLVGNGFCCSVVGSNLVSLVSR